MYKLVILTNVALKKPVKPVKTVGKIFNTKNMEPTIVKGILARPAAMIARTIRVEAIFPIGDMSLSFNNFINLLSSPIIFSPLFNVNLY